MMADRIRHDHPTVETISAVLGRFGGTRRPEIRIAEMLQVEADEVMRLVLDGTEYRSRIEQTGGNPVIRGAYNTPRQARDPGGGPNHLPEWVESREIPAGGSLHLDVVEPGFKYGLRAPGEEMTYSTGQPDTGLADIAQQLDPDS